VLVGQLVRDAQPAAFADHLVKHAARRGHAQSVRMSEHRKCGCACMPMHRSGAGAPER
jgi:hypothetical protein